METARGGPGMGIGGPAAPGATAMEGPGMFFLSTFENRIDRKGRVSVPAPYRNTLERINQSLIVTRSLTHDCLEGQGAARIDQVIDAIDAMDSLSDEAEILQTMLSSAMLVKPDNEGRILLPEEFLAYARITDTVVFAGAGRLFRLWSPAAWQAFEDGTRKRIKEGGLPRLVLKPRPAPPDKEGS